MSREDMDSVLDECVRLAVHQLEKEGEFYPFGVTRDPEGKFTLAHANLRVERPTSEQVMQSITRGLITQAKEGRFTTVAMVSDVRVRNPDTRQFNDAIRVVIEDREAESLVFFLPYTRENGKIVTGSILAEEMPRLIFA